MAIVRFNYADICEIRIGRKKQIKEFVVEIFESEGKPLKRIDYVFCSDDYLLEINRSFLKHDYFTDIITFDLSEDLETVGEVYVSIDRVRENSQTHGATYSEELLRVIFHGALHLIGYGDKKKREITLMREKEDHYLRLFELK